MCLFHCERVRHEYDLFAWVVMPNHIHALFSLPPGGALESLVQSWKNFTARRIKM